MATSSTSTNSTAVSNNSNVAVVQPTTRPTNNQSILVDATRPTNQLTTVNVSRRSNQSTTVNGSRPANEWIRAYPLPVAPPSEWIRGDRTEPFTGDFFSRRNNESSNHSAAANAICSVCQQIIRERNAPIITRSIYPENAPRHVPRRRTYAYPQNSLEITNGNNQNGSLISNNHIVAIDNTWMPPSPANETNRSHLNMLSGPAVPSSSITETIPTVSLIDIGFYDD